MMSAPIAGFKDRPDLVETIQRKLRYVDLYRGPCDGRYGRELEQAIRRFRLKNKLEDSEGCDQETYDRILEAAGFTFADVQRDELAALRTEKALPQRGGPEAAQVPFSQQVTDAAHRAALAGLAFSGGGIRSATFNLGIVQALAETKLLHHFDYLSTVSGGGYIGGWLSKWIAKCDEGVAGVENAMAQAANQAEPRREPVQVTFLRQYSNYLTPRAGLFTADTWAFFATYIRNTLLNFWILGLVLAAVLIVPRLWVRIAASGIVAREWYLYVAGLAFLFVVHNIAYTISRRPDPDAKRPHGQRWVLWFIVLPLMLAAILGSLAVWWYRDPLACAWLPSGSPPCTPPLSGRLRPPAGLEFASRLPILVLPGVLYFGAWATGWVRAQLRNRRHAAATAPGRGPGAVPVWRQGLAHLSCAVGAFAIGTALLAAVAATLKAADPAYLVHVASVGPAVLLGLFGITMVIMIGLIGRNYSDRSREWWSRQGGWAAIGVFGWMALVLSSIYSPVLMMWIHVNAGSWGSAVLASGWLGTAWATLWAARKPEAGKPGAGRMLKALVVVGPAVVMVLVFMGVSTAIYLAFRREPAAAETGLGAILQTHSEQAALTPARGLFFGMLVCFAVAALFSNRVDVNKFSLYMMYRNRLVRAYLGAVDAGKRGPDPFTGFDPHDDLPLDAVGGRNGKLQRPYLIVNTALNLVKGKELAWQTRKAANFTFTPRFCGFETPQMPVSGTVEAADDEEAHGRFRRTGQYGRDSGDPDEADRGVKLGMAMAISGAAVGSSMGAHSSSALAFVTTLFNARLGRWCGNPASRDESWKKASPPVGLGYLLAELFGNSHARTPYLYLSDGGHFENLGIYELVRRRCRLIVAIDASADGALQFGDLGNAVRKCYTDFNIEIDINVKSIELAAATGFSSAYYVVGKILYGATDPKAADGSAAPDGTLLYIKPSLRGTEFVNIANYHMANPEFPHQTTADQWFDETQFETYRSLGNHIGRAVFAELWGNAAAETGKGSAVEQLCAAIERNVRAQQRKPRERLSATPWHARHWT